MDWAGWGFEVLRGGGRRLHVEMYLELRRIVPKLLLVFIVLSCWCMRARTNTHTPVKQRHRVDQKETGADAKEIGSKGDRGRRKRDRIKRRQG